MDYGLAPFVFTNARDVISHIVSFVLLPCAVVCNNIQLYIQYIYIYIYNIYIYICLLLSESTQSRDLNFALEAFKASLRTYFRNRYYRVILLNRHRSFDWSWLKINQKVFCSSI